MDRTIKLSYQFCFCLIIISCSNTATNDQPQWKSIFNGKDLSGWQVKITGHEPGDNYGNTFRAEDGLLKVRYDEYDTFKTEFGHLFYEKELKNYRLRLEYRFVGHQPPGGPDWAWRNSGLMLHGQSAKSMGLDQDFPISLEMQFLGGRTGEERPTGNLCTPGAHVMINNELITGHCITGGGATIVGDEWVKAEVVVFNDSIIHHLINNDTVITYTKPQIGGEAVSGFDPEIKKDGTPLKSGTISLQSEGHPVDFRNIELMELD